MKFVKLVALLMFSMIICLQSSPAWAQDEGEEEEAPQAKDTPYFSGMPNYWISNAEDREFDEYNFYNGKDCTRIEGQKMYRVYSTKDGATPASELQVARNYANAIKSMGGTIIFDGTCEGAECARNCGYRMVVGKAVKGDNELWVEMVTYNDGYDYELVVVVKEAMKQDITAGAMFEALNKDGHVALYINFDFGKATIRPDSKPVIDQIAEMMKANPGLEISVEGHTDNVGKAASNQKLSEDRANAVVKEIVARGIDSKRMTAVGRGQDVPIADNNTEEGRAINRRVELVKKGSAPSGKSDSGKSDSDKSDAGAAKEHLGIKVYPGAKFNKEQSDYTKQTLGYENYCYTTSDDVKKVMAFYDKQGNLMLLGSDEASAWYGVNEEGSTIKIAIANPWTDPKGGGLHNETLIQIIDSK